MSWQISFTGNSKILSGSENKGQTDGRRLAYCWRADVMFRQIYRAERYWWADRLAGKIWAFSSLKRSLKILIRPISGEETKKCLKSPSCISTEGKIFEKEKNL